MDFGGPELRNLKDFLLLFNKISEQCFTRCVSNLGQASLDEKESSCITVCVEKHCNVNHKTMALFSEISPAFNERRLKEQQVEFQKLQEQIDSQNQNTPLQPEIESADIVLDTPEPENPH